VPGRCTVRQRSGGAAFAHPVGELPDFALCCGIEWLSRGLSTRVFSHGPKSCRVKPSDAAIRHLDNTMLPKSTYSPRCIDDGYNIISTAREQTIRAQDDVHEANAIAFHIVDNTDLSASIRRDARNDEVSFPRDAVGGTILSPRGHASAD